MSYDSASFSQHSMLSPPLLAAIDSQHIFGSYDATPSSSRTATHRTSIDASSVAHDQPSTALHHRRTRSRASSAASVNNIGPISATALSSVQQQNGNSSSHRRTRRVHHGHSNGHSRNGSRSGPIPTPGRSATLNTQSASAASEETRPLSSSLRNRSTPHLAGLRTLSAAHEQRHSISGSAVSAFTAPSSPLLSAAASMALAMSPVAQASAMTNQLMPSDWTLDGSAPTSPRPNISRNASDYFDPALLAQLQSQNASSHPELHAHGARAPDPSPPMDTVFGRLPPHPSSHHAARSASQSEWAQHAAHMQQTAHLLGLQRLFASRSTPHLPDLDSSYLGHDFESPPPYAPRASALETELERAADMQASAPTDAQARQTRHASNSSSASTIFNGAGNDPPLPPPISIPADTGGGGGGHTASGLLSTSASSSARPSLRARSSSRGSRSGPPSPSASFYGRRGLTSLSPFPAGLEMTPSVMHVSQFSSTPASPGFAADSDGDEDLDGALSFSSSRSKQRRDERRQTISLIENGSRTDLTNGSVSASLPGSSTQAQAVLSRRKRSGSAGGARQLLRPRTPINPTLSQHTANSSAHVSLEENHASSAVPTPDALRNAASDSRRGDHATTNANRLTNPNQVHHNDTDYNAEHTDQPISPTSDSTQPESPSSPGASPDFFRSDPFASNTDHSRPRPERADDTSPTKVANVNADDDDDEEFPLVLKLLLHPLRILAAVPGCIGTFWLARNAWVLATRHGHLLSPGQMLTSPDGTSHFWSADLSTPPISGPLRLGRQQPGSLDFAVACLWSMSTAYHALSFTTLLLRRWLLYYSILPSLIRLVALQAICWPLVRLTVHVFGPDQPLGAWVVIGTTTALSDVVSRWVTSNIADAPLDDEVDEDEQEEAEEALGYLSDSRFVKSPTRPSAAERLFGADSHPHSAAGGVSLVGDSDWDPRSGDESDAAAASLFASERERQRKQRRGGQGTRFWRAVIGGPSFASSRKRKNVLTTPNGRDAGGVTETEVEGESDWPGYGTDGTVVGAARRLHSDGLRRRWPVSAQGVASSPPSAREGMFGSKRTVLPPFPFKPSTYRQGSSRHTRYVYRDGAWVRERTSSRRNFHWEVAVWRNVVPIAVLSYLSMWILVLDAMRLGG